MSVAFTEGVATDRGETIPPDGAIVRLDVRSTPRGAVAIEDGAAGERRENSGAQPDAEADAQLAALVTSFHGEIAHGNDGHTQVVARLRTPIVETTEENVRRALTEEEVGDFLTYGAWNLWDLIAARSTEGESGLIPRQEYETVSFVQEWATYPGWMRRIEEAVGRDGVIELGRASRDEIGTKNNYLHSYCVGLATLSGRGLALSMGLEDPAARPQDLETVIQFFRGLQHGHWGGGPGFVSGRGYQARVLGDHWIARFCDEERRLSDPDALAAFRRFNATTELLGFLLHYDCRVGMCDTGPYPLPGGGFALVRDHFLHEPAYEWADVVADLPYCVTQVMFFRPDGRQEIALNDIATTFARPQNYLKHLSGAVVYARDRWDTPMSELRILDDAEMEHIVTRCNAAMLDLYASIGEKSRDERIRNGVKVYTRDMIMPYARAAGLWETFLAEGFDDFAPLTEQAYGPLVDGSAAEVLGGVFLMGAGILPDGALGSAPDVGSEALASLHAIALRGTLADPPGDVDELVAAGLVATTPVGCALTEAGHARHAELLEAERETLDLDRLEGIYDRFLAVNGELKAACAQPDADPEMLAAELAELLDRAEPILRRTAEVLPRFGGYAERLGAALDRADAGAEEYLLGPAVDSVHTVWMEMHEDYLQTLGRSRELEGSY